jgi:hypothetical protein
MEQNYLLELRGKLAGRLFDFSGGQAVGMEHVGPRVVLQKHIAGLEFEDITVACGTGMSSDFYQWIGSAFNRDYNRRDGAVIFVQHGQPVKRYEFSQALVTSVSMPALDRSSKNEAHMRVSFQPERSRSHEPGKTGVGVYTGVLQKAWHISDFRIQIDGLENECRHVTRIESLVVRQGTVAVSTGVTRDLSREPTKIEFPNLVVYLPGMYAGGIFKWLEDAVVRRGGQDMEKNGSIDFLAPGSSISYFGLKLKQIGVKQVASPHGGPKSMAPVKVEMYCESMTFAAGGAAVK